MEPLKLVQGEVLVLGGRRVVDVVFVSGWIAPRIGFYSSGVFEKSHFNL